MLRMLHAFANPTSAPVALGCLICKKRIMEKVREWYEVENGPDSELEVRHQMQRDVGQRIGARTMRCFDVSEKVEVCCGPPVSVMNLVVCAPWRMICSRTTRRTSLIRLEDSV